MYVPIQIESSNRQQRHVPAFRHECQSLLFECLQDLPEDSCVHENVRFGAASRERHKFFHAA